MVAGFGSFVGDDVAEDAISDCMQLCMSAWMDMHACRGAHTGEAYATRCRSTASHAAGKSVQQMLGSKRCKGLTERWVSYSSSVRSWIMWLLMLSSGEWLPSLSDVTELEMRGSDSLPWTGWKDVVTCSAVTGGAAIVPT